MIEHGCRGEEVGINERLITNLRNLSHTMHFLYEGKGSQKRILIILDEIGGSITQQKLTERLGIKPGSSSEVISKLENGGYILRTPNTLDRRTADIVLTEDGKRLATEAREQRVRRHEQMFSCLTEGEKEQLLALLEKINQDWEVRYQNLGTDCGPHDHRGGRHHRGRPRHMKGE